MSCRAIERTVFDGIAKPTPSEPPDSLSICALTPITRPRRSRSGPPELPWLMAASVWIVSVIVKLFGAVISRWSALTIPLVIVPSRPNGLPSASTGSPTSTALESASRSGAEQACGRVDAEDGEIGRRIGSDELGVELDAVPEAHRDRRRACDDVLVRDDVAARRRRRSPEPCALAPAATRRQRDLDDRLRRAVVDLRRRTGRSAATGSEPSTVTCRTTVVVPSSSTANAAAPRPSAEHEGGDEAGDESGVRERAVIGVRHQCGGTGVARR